MPINGTGGDDFNKAKPYPLYLPLEGSLDIFFCSLVIGWCVERASGTVGSSLECSHHLGGMHWIALRAGASSLWGSTGYLPCEGCRGQLAAGGAVVGVVDHNYGNLL